MSLRNSTKQTRHKKFAPDSDPVNNFKPRPNPIISGIKWLVLIFLFGILAWIVTKITLGIPAFSTLPTVYEVGNGVALFDRFNHHITTVYADRDSIPIPLSKMSSHMRHAAIAAEDHRFYEHHGVDPWGVTRAILTNVKAGHMRQGGSTITQQLVRNLYLDPQDRSAKRKIMEALLSVDVELNNSKNRILETYLNDIYFGRGVYGIERAAGTYFNKHAGALDVGESAFLAGLIRAPSRMSDPKYLDDALDRQHQVLDAMAEEGFISQEQADSIKAKKLVFRKGQAPTQPYPYYANYVVQLLKNQFSETQLWGSGLRVYTNLDPEAQNAAENQLNKGIETAPNGISQGALVTINVKDGGVLALVGGVGDYRLHQFNRATNPHTAGSAFKPFVYLAGIMNDALKPDTVLEDLPLTIDVGFGQKYSPKNFDGRYLGRITVRTALMLSRNLCSIRIARAVGPQKIIDTARAAGITSPLNNDLPLALGASAVSPLELANAYATLARKGVFMPWQMIRQIDDNQGHKLQEATPQAKSVFPSEPVLQLVDILQDVVNKGTGTLARLPKIAVAGKTGTADKARDIWFVGFTPDVVTAVWGGNDDYSEVKGNVTGGTVMAKIWHDYMTDFYKTHEPPTVAFDEPAVPFAKKITRINPSVLKQIEDTEAGLNPDESKAPAEGEQSAGGETNGADNPNATNSGEAGTLQKIPDAPPPPEDPNHPASTGADSQLHAETPHEAETHKEELPAKAPEIQQEPPRAPEIHQPAPEPAPSVHAESPQPAPVGGN
jgi:penicillin-binding protein 1A